MRCLAGLLSSEDDFVFGAVVFVDLVDGIDDIDDVLHINGLVGTDKDAGFGVARSESVEFIDEDSLHFVDKFRADRGREWSFVDLELATSQRAFVDFAAEVGDVDRHALFGHGLVVAFGQEELHGVRADERGGEHEEDEEQKDEVGH